MSKKAIIFFLINVINSRAINGSSTFFATIFAEFVLVAMHWLFSALAFHLTGLESKIKGRSRVLNKKTASACRSQFKAALVCLWQYIGKEPKFILHIGDVTNNVVYNLVLGLLLVFRTNASYERFWDGRKALGVLVVNLRNLARFIRLSIPEENAEERDNKAAILKLLGAFVVATKLQLRGEKPNEELKILLNEKQALEIDSAQRMSLQIALWIGEYLQQQLKLGRIDSSQRVEMNNMLNNMIEGLSSCERIATTPLPIAYRIYEEDLISNDCWGTPILI